MLPVHLLHRQDSTTRDMWGCSRGLGGAEEQAGGPGGLRQLHVVRRMNRATWLGEELHRAHSGDSSRAEEDKVSFDALGDAQVDGAGPGEGELVPPALLREERYAE